MAEIIEHDRATPDQTLTRSERLDRLKPNPEHRKLLWGSGIGWALDAMDVGLISFVIAALSAQQLINATEASWIASIGFIGMALGATFGGLIADKIGRRQVFALTLLVYGLATGASALVTSVALLMAFRFIVGLGLGAELPVASTLVSEFAPRKTRGRMVVWLEAFWAVGWILAAIIGTFIVSASDSGWRWALALGAVPALYALYVRLGLPESVRFLESRGKMDEAEAAVRKFEAAGGVDLSLPKAAPAPRASEDSAGEAGSDAAGAISIWSASMRKRTIGLWIVWFCINLSYYGAFIWIPSLLVDAGFTVVKSFTFTLIITLAQLPGYAVAAWLIEVWGRRGTLAVFLAGSALAAALYGYSGIAGEEWLIILAGCLLSFFNLGAWGALYAIGPELYPTNIRGTGAGAAAGFGRIASIIAPLLVPVLVTAGGGDTVLVFTVFAAAFAIAAAATFLLPEQKGKALAD
ncbi:MAG: MFS transporter [Gulosibacter sp.]|uniref:MFS transporter n=1 Tax=Gulosibacter sp. TaxID=2817531 RepID=UPI003F92E66C